MKLYSYWRSSSSWRVRIALALKGLGYEYVPVHLLEDGGQQHAEDFVEKNPAHQIPVLELEIDGLTCHIGQSMAILDFLEQTHPEPALLPGNPFLRSRAFQLAELVNSGIQPIQNLSVIQELRRLDVDARAWCHDAILSGLEAYEALSKDVSGTFSVGDAPSWADACLIPQMYNARRFEVDMSHLEGILAIEQAAFGLEAFQVSHPDQQPDAQ